MKLMTHYKFYILLLASLTIMQPVNADSLGRLFTTPGERITLDKVRNAKPKPEKLKRVEVPKIEELIEPEVEVEDPNIGHAITLRGIVQRSDGKNAAWLNKGNTFEGDLESQYIKVDNNDITEDHVEITMPDNKTKIKLKVGDNYDPQDDEGL
ncbi:MAG: hypothetical protein ACI85N_001049 [Gammaproteobacteria bacterium]|jgi:hypothetical protein